MTAPKKPFTEKEKKARDLLMRPRLRFEPKSPEKIAAEKKAREKMKWEKAAAGTLRIGTEMPDGSIYAGMSPDTREPLYTTPRDARDGMMFYRAKGYAEKLNTNGHQDWRLPTKNELSLLFNNCAAIKGFDGGEYWSSTPYQRFPGQRFPGFVCTKNFTTGADDAVPTNETAARVRCVRGG